MSLFHFYTPPVYLKLFGVKPESNLFDLWQKRKDLMGGQTEEHFKQNNPKTYIEINTAWALLTDPETSPYKILGVSKNIDGGELDLVYNDLICRFPLIQEPKCNRKITRAYAILINPEKRLLIDFFMFDDSLYDLYFLENDDEIAVRRLIEREFSGSIFKQILNSTLFCYLKACQIESSKGDFDQARAFWEKAYLGWQGIFQEAFIWEEFRTRAVSGKLFPHSFHTFSDDSMEQLKVDLKTILIENSLDRAFKALEHSVQATLHHLDFLKGFNIEQETYRTQIARIYNQCAYLLSQEDRLEESRGLLEVAKSLDPDLTEAKTNLELAQTATSGIGQALRMLSQNNEIGAMELLGKILESNPENNDARELFVTLLLKMSHECCRVADFEKAYHYISKAAALREDCKQEHELVIRCLQKGILGEVLQYLQNEEYDQVIRILREYTKDYPDQEVPKKLLSRVLNLTAIIRNRQHKWTEARDLLREALFLESDNDVFASNLARVDKAAENQQVANDLSKAKTLMEEGNPKEAIDLLLPLYTELSLPSGIVEDMRLFLSRAYFQYGMIIVKEAENATSRGAIEEAFISAHRVLTISDFLDSQDNTLHQINQLEEAVPELLDQEYDASVFPQARGERRRPRIRRKRSRIPGKIKSKIRILFDILPKIFSTPIFLPLTFLPLLLISYLLMKSFGGDFLSGLVLALMVQCTLSCFSISKIKPERKKLLIVLSGIAALLAVGDFYWVGILDQKLPSVMGFFVRQRPLKPTPTQKPLVPKSTPSLKIPTPSMTPFSEVPEGPGFFRPLFEVGKLLPAVSSSQLASASTQTRAPEPEISSTPIITATPTPSMLGQFVEIEFTIQEFIGVRQKPSPAFLYRINTRKGVASLLIDPLVYIKIPKVDLAKKGWHKARAKVLSESEVHIYSMESPGDFHVE